MSNILLVTSSPRGAESQSNRIATELATRLADQSGKAVVTRDLVSNPDIANGDYDIHWLEKYLAASEQG